MFLFFFFLSEPRAVSPERKKKEWPTVFASDYTRPKRETLMGNISSTHPICVPLISRNVRHYTCINSWNLLILLLQFTVEKGGGGRFCPQLDGTPENPMPTKYTDSDMNGDKQQPARTPEPPARGPSNG